MIDIRTSFPPIKLDSTNAYLTKKNIYKFTDEVSNKDLLLKIIDDFDDGLSESILEAEFRKMINLSSVVGICPVYFLCKAEVNGEVKTAYAMEFIRGETLKQYLEKSITVETFVQFAQYIYNAIQAAHRYNIAHMDLHDENILISVARIPIVIDFCFVENFSQESIKKDYEAFKEIINLLFRKLSKKDQMIFSILRDCICSLNNFETDFDFILEVNEIIKELKLLPVDCLEALDKIIVELPDDFHLGMSLMKKNMVIDPNYVRPFARTGSQRIETEIIGLTPRIEGIYEFTLGLFKSIGLIKSFNLKIINVGEKNVGPYHYSYSVFYTSKIIKWSLIRRSFNFLPVNSPKDLDEIVFVRYERIYGKPKFV
jgi:tRNA A-37 threonylcarbamoyl transferase component Bud32